MNIIEDMTLSDEIIREWIKWLSYTPDFIEERINKIYEKKVEELSINELNEVINYKEGKEILKLFNKYNFNTITKKEKIRVNIYVQTHNIEDIMNNKLSVDELKYVKNKLSELKKLQYETVSIMQMIEIDKNKATYEKLSMTDAYILHYLSKISFEKYIDNLNEKINKEVNEKLKK